MIGGSGGGLADTHPHDVKVQLYVLRLMPVDPVLLQNYSDVAPLCQGLLKPPNLPLTRRPSRIWRRLPIQQLILQIACLSPTRILMLKRCRLMKFLRL